MKTKEELITLKGEVETLNKKLAELSEEELAQVTGGLRMESQVLTTPGSNEEPVVGTDSQGKIVSCGN